MTTHICDHTPSGEEPESARALLYRYGLPEDIIDGALALFAQELAGKIRVWHDRLPGEHECCDGNAADLISPENWARTEAASAVPVAASPTEQAALRERIAEAIRAAACPGGCGKTEEECARERIQPFVWHHGRLAVVEGAPEMFADAVLAVLPPPADRATVAELAHAIDNSTPYPIELDPQVCRFMAERLLEMLTVGKRPEHPVWQPEEEPTATQPEPEDPSRLPAETPQPPQCAECGHPKDTHQEGDDPVTPGTCSVCGDDDRHDYEADETPQPETQAARPGGDYEATTGHEITCGAGFGADCTCDPKPAAVQADEAAP